MWFMIATQFLIIVALGIEILRWSMENLELVLPVIILNTTKWHSKMQNTNQVFYVSNVTYMKIMEISNSSLW